MPIQRLQMLLDKALAARDATGPAAAAERLLLFAPVTSTLEQLLKREISRRAAAVKVRQLSRDLSTHLRAIERAAVTKTSDTEHVQAYYETAIRLKTALREIELAYEDLTVYEELK